jgi:hypothetical protein
MYFNLLCLLIIPAFFFVDSWNKYSKLDTILDNYMKLLNDPQFEEKEWLLQSHERLKDLLKSAKVEDIVIRAERNVAYGNIEVYNASVLESFPSKQPRVSFLTLKLIHAGLGVYKDRMRNSFNPLYWINSIIFFPRALFSYLGMDSDKLATKILQGLWWIALTIGVALFK